MANDLWRWAEPDGREQSAGLEELRAALAAGRIAPNTPVLRTGSERWQPANEVPELATGAGAAASASKATMIGNAAAIPPPPAAMLEVQEQYEKASASLAPPSLKADAPAPSSGQLPGGAPMGLPTAIGLPPPPDMLAAVAAARTAANGLPPPTEPVVRSDVTSHPSLADVVPRSPLALLLEDIAAIRAGRPPANKRLLVVGGVLGVSVLMLLGAGLVTCARAVVSPSASPASSAAASASAPAASAASGVAPPKAADTVVPPPPPPTETTRSAPVLGDCTIAAEAKMIAPRAVIASAVEGNATGGLITFGYAAAPRDAVAVAVDPSTLAVTSTGRVRPIGDARRVTPAVSAGKVVPYTDVDRKGDRVSARRAAVGEGGASVDLGFADGAIVSVAHGKDAPSKLFSLDGDGAVEALRAAPLPNGKGFALAFRRGNAIHAGVAKGDATLEALGSLSKISGLGQVGSPSIAVSGDSVVVAWADRASADVDWQIRWTKFAIGNATEEARTFDLPEGGAGGPAMSPSVAPLGGGRFLLAWAEGPVSGHQVRAITIDAEGKPSGSALVVSPPGMNAGQPAAVVGPDGRGAIGFIAAKGKSLTVQAAGLRCPPR